MGRPACASHPQLGGMPSRPGTKDASPQFRRFAAQGRACRISVPVRRIKPFATLTDQVSRARMASGNPRHRPSPVRLAQACTPRCWIYRAPVNRLSVAANAGVGHDGACDAPRKTKGGSTASALGTRVPSSRSFRSRPPARSRLAPRQRRWLLRQRCWLRLQRQP
jgi:hypothetical protein